MHPPRPKAKAWSPPHEGLGAGYRQGDMSRGSEVTARLLGARRARPRGGSVPDMAALAPGPPTNEPAATICAHPPTPKQAPRGFIDDVPWGGGEPPSTRPPPPQSTRALSAPRPGVADPTPSSLKTTHCGGNAACAQPMQRQTWRQGRPPHPMRRRLQI